VSTSDDSAEKIDEVTNGEYTLTQNEVGFQIRVVYTPVRADGAEGTRVVSTSIEPVCAGMRFLYIIYLYLMFV
jgi:hypothetical protein